MWPPLPQAMCSDLMTEWDLVPGEPWPPEKVEAEDVCLKPVTPAKLKQAFEYWCCLHFGLPPEAASLIAGRPVLMRKTSLTYLKTSYDRLLNEYNPVCESLLQTIIDHTENPAQTRANLPPTKKPTSPKIQGAVGSWYCPRTETVKNLISGMRNRVLELQSSPPSVYQEALCMYSFEILRLVTGMRAMAEPPFTSASFFSAGKWMRLCEKGRDLWRVIPLHPVALELVQMLEDANNDLLFHNDVYIPHLHRLKTRESLFWIVQDEVALPLTYEKQIDIARKHGIDYPDLPANAYRHFNRSKQFEYGFSYRIADFSLGHLQRGPHTLNNFSLVSPESLAREYLIFVDRLLDELNIKPLAVK